MPAEHRGDPNLVDLTLRDAVNAQLTRLRHAALETSHELVAHYSDTGDAVTQRAVDNLIEHAADSLRALTDSFADSSHELPANASRREAGAFFGGSSRRDDRRV